jgi:hypothetical protein
VTQNSGVVVSGDESSSNMTWYGVIINIISLEFSQQKEVILFQCDWYDVPANNTSISRGHTRDKFGIIDIATSMFRYSDEPHILASNAEPVFYVPIVDKPGWSTIVSVRPRNLFSMPDTGNDADALDVGIQDRINSVQVKNSQTGQDQIGQAQVVLPTLLIKCGEKQLQNLMITILVTILKMMTPTLMMGL